MALRIVYEDLVDILKSFHLITGLRIGVFDCEGNELAAYPRQVCAFCAALRRSKGFLAASRQSDVGGFERAQRLKKVHIYKCHFGLTEALTPIIEEEKTIGFIIIGQLLEDTESDENLHAILENCRRHGYDAELFHGLLHEVPRISHEKIRACAAIMTACAGYLQLTRLVKEQNTPLFVRVKQYLDENYSRRVTLDELSEALRVGKTTLCNLAQTFFGMGTIEYLNHIRLQKAQSLLAETDIPVGRIAEMVGFAEQNYFSRLFRQGCGMTPTEFRRGTS